VVDEGDDFENGVEVFFLLVKEDDYFGVEIESVNKFLY
jgi:hypothetical protein